MGAENFRNVNQAMRLVRAENLSNMSTKTSCFKHFWGKNYKQCQHWAMTSIAYRKEMRVSENRALLLFFNKTSKNEFTSRLFDMAVLMISLTIYLIAVACATFRSARRVAPGSVLSAQSAPITAGGRAYERWPGDVITSVLLNFDSDLHTIIFLEILPHLSEIWQPWHAFFGNPEF